jgi:hypothetical protein
LAGQGWSGLLIGTLAYGFLDSKKAAIQKELESKIDELRKLEKQSLKSAKFPHTHFCNGIKIATAEENC